MKSMPIGILEDIENNPDLVAGRKYNGFSELLVVKDGRIRLFNQSGSEQTDNVPHLTGVVVPKGMDLTLTGEGIAPSDKVGDAKSIFGSGPVHSINWQKNNGRARLIAVNITRYLGEDLAHIPFGERLTVLDDAVCQLIDLGVRGLHSETLHKVGKSVLFQNVLAVGGEGVVIKQLSGFERDWYKVKKFKSWDAVIMGFTQGQGKYKDVIGAIRYGFYDPNGNLRETGRCSGMTDAERAMFASSPEVYIGRVVEIKGQELGSRGGIIFPRFVRIRNDKFSIDCLLPK